MIQWAKRTAENTFSPSGALCPPGRMRSRARSGIEHQERGNEDGREDAEIDPVGWQRERAGRREQGHSRQNEEHH